MEFVTIPAGAGLIGSSEVDVDHCVAEWGTSLVDARFSVHELRQWILKEYPQRRVRFDAFRIGRFPVTNAEYRRYVQSGAGAEPPSFRNGAPDDWPVWGVSLDDSQRFAAWMGRQLNAACRLPTEEEWEYAARGADGREYPFGYRFDPSMCNTVEAGIGHPTPVHAYATNPSAFGVCDLAGNVEEWTSSRYYPYPGGVFIHDELTKISGSDYPILRGGSFARGGDLTRCARRHGPHPGPEYQYRGIRLLVEER